MKILPVQNPRMKLMHHHLQLYFFWSSTILTDSDAQYFTVFINFDATRDQDYRAQRTHTYPLCRERKHPGPYTNTGNAIYSFYDHFLPLT
jgi:hypothetical protein